MPETIALLGAGNMGTAVAQVLASNGHAVRAWSIEADVLEEIRDRQLNTKYLSGVKLHPGIEPVWDLAEAVHGAAVIVLSVPSQIVSRMANDLYIVGPPGVEAWIEEFADRCYPNISKDAGYKRKYIDAVPRKQQQAGSVSFWSVPMNHVKEHMDAFGYRVTINGKTVAYTGDTMICDEVFELAEGSDVLVIDCTYSDGRGPEHMGLDDAKVIRERIAPETAIVLTHLDGSPHLDGLKNVVTAEDLKTFRF